MYLRLTRARFDPSIYDQVLPLAREVDTAMRQLPGLHHYHPGFNRTAGTVAAVSVWDSEEHANFARESLGELIGGLRALGVQFEEPEIYEIMSGEGASA